MSCNIQKYKVFFIFKKSYSFVKNYKQLNILDEIVKDNDLFLMELKLFNNGDSDLIQMDEMGEEYLNFIKINNNFEQELDLSDSDDDSENIIDDISLDEVEKQKLFIKKLLNFNDINFNVNMDLSLIDNKNFLNFMNYKNNMLVNFTFLKVISNDKDIYLDLDFFSLSIINYVYVFEYFYKIRVYYFKYVFYNFVIDIDLQYNMKLIQNIEFMEKGVKKILFPLTPTKAQINIDTEMDISFKLDDEIFNDEFQFID